MASTPPPPITGAIDASPAGVEAQDAAPRRFRVGAVTHGYQFDGNFPSWVTEMTGALQGIGYHVAIPFDWAARSKIAAQEITIQVAHELVTRIVSTLRQLLPTVGPGDGVDLHLIGHSRGSVVMSQVAISLQAMVLGGSLPQMAESHVRLTFLDPHPAHNTHTFGVPSKAWYSDAEGPAGKLAVLVYKQFQNAARDPEVFAPDIADEVEVFSQHAGHAASPDPFEQVLNLWGEVPVLGRPAQYCDLTGAANGHGAVHNWYRQQAVPRLATGSPIPCPGHAGTPLSVIASDEEVATANEPAAEVVAGATRKPDLLALYPAEIDDLEVAQEIQRRQEAIGNALEQQKTAEASSLLYDLYAYVETERGRHLTNRAADFLEDQIHVLLESLRSNGTPLEP